MHISYAHKIYARIRSLVIINSQTVVHKTYSHIMGSQAVYEYCIREYSAYWNNSSEICFI